MIGNSKYIDQKSIDFTIDSLNIDDADIQQKLNVNSV